MAETTRRAVVLGAGGVSLGALLTACAGYGQPAEHRGRAGAHAVGLVGPRAHEVEEGQEARGGGTGQYGRHPRGWRQGLRPAEGRGDPALSG
ncbi:hypothetical protein [Nonomuraea dietziae]|uniref:hypothetical protein n=1 Tax=Nonomuraea dietziae TaxID=65515 RepID=UPI0031CF09CB